MDLGGDGNRLYFYDPVSFIKHVSLYGIDSEGKGNVEQRHAYLIYVSLIAVIKYIVQSPYIVIALFNGFKLSVGFLSVYFIVKELIGAGAADARKRLSVEAASIISGLFYIVSTASEKLIFFWAKALHSHDQIFLNPLMFLLLLRYFLSGNLRYLYGSLIVSFVFSLNFSMNSAPPFFAFYPIAAVFLFLYVFGLRKVAVPIWQCAAGLGLFVGLQSFHLLPSIVSLLTPNSATNSVVFKESVTGGVNYFLAVRGMGKAISGFFVPTSQDAFRWSAFIAPLVLIAGYLIQRKKRNDIMLVSVFFFLTFFLVTANITDFGLAAYTRLFYIPGFSMFRNFSSQWAYSFLFFYALLFGFMLFELYSRMKRRIVLPVTLGIIVIFTVSNWTFLTGQLVDRVLWGSNGVKSAFIMDPRYEKTLEYIRTLPDDGKMLLLPLTDNFNQVIFGLNNAAYVGPSSISILTSKRSFSGYQILYPDPIPEVILKFAREKNYAALSQIFSLFNIRYIYYNSDPNIYEAKFPNFPNSYMMTSLPNTQAGYAEFIKHLPVRLIYENGPFHIFEFDMSVYRPEAYVPEVIYMGNVADNVQDATSYVSAFVDARTCGNPDILEICKNSYVAPRVRITSQRVNPTKYIFRVRHAETSVPFLFVFQNSYHTGWNISIDDGSFLPERRHIQVNSYANAWIITDGDRHGKTDYTVHVSLETQKYFLYGLMITGGSLIIVLISGIRLFMKKRKASGV